MDIHRPGWDTTDKSWEIRNVYISTNIANTLQVQIPVKYYAD